MKHLYFCSCDEAGGIYHYILSDGELTFCDKLDLDRPMYMIISKSKAYIALREIDETTHFGGVVTADIDKDGKLVNLSEPQSSLGVVPCHLCVNNGEIYTVNYLSGNLVKLPDLVVKHEGKGVDPIRQEAPHTHFVCAAPDGYVLCCDLGLDTVFTYDSDLNKVSEAKVPSGHGCRHLEFSGDQKTVYCVNEMGNTVSVFDYENGVLTLRETINALTNFYGQNTAAAIRRDGDFIYISHRGSDTVARFKIDESNNIKLLENTAIGGVSPRDIWIEENLLLCANELTDSITVLELDNGKPIKYKTALPMKHPLCICAIDI